MYSESRTHDTALVVKAVLSNGLAAFAPKAYMRLTGETGRGKEETRPTEVTDYFLACFDDYFTRLDVAPERIDAFLAGKRILELGPGDLLGVALLLYARGAESVDCIDRFDLERLTPANLAIYRLILDRLEGGARERAVSAFVDGRPERGLRPDAIRYMVGKDGLSGAVGQYDLIVSRAVLEHVNDIGRTMRDIATALRPDGLSIHQVDLKSHGLDRYQPFDFLTWPDSLYRAMYSHKGFPNRWRVDAYRAHATACGLRIRALEPTGQLSDEQVARIAPDVARPLRSVPRDELGWLGFWIMLERDDGIA